VGRQITTLVHFAEESPDALVAGDTYTARSVMTTQLFSMADGPALIAFDDGTKLHVGSSEELVSVTVAAANEAELDADWPYRIEATDTQHSEPRFAEIVGRRIAGIRVLQRIFDASERGKIIDRPCEVGLVLELAGGGLLVFSNGLVDAPNNFAVITELELDRTTMRYREVLRIP
jgi:hypothetical protein